MISNAIQRLRATVSGINRETLTLFIAQWKGRGVELLSSLSAHMHQSPFKACSALVIANGLFYGLVSHHVANYLDNCCDPSGKGQNNRWAGVVVLGTCTALFNLGISKLTQFQLSRVALLAITSVVIALRLIFKIDTISSLNPFLEATSPQGKDLPTTNLQNPQLLLPVASKFVDNRDGLEASGSSSDPLQVVFDTVENNVECKRYQSLLKLGIMQEEIDSILHVCAEKSPNLAGDALNRTLRILKQSLIPLLGADTQTNRAIIDAIVTDFRQSATWQQDDPRYDFIKQEDILRMQLCLQNVCFYFRYRQSLRDVGYADSQLATLVDAVGVNNRHHALRGFYDLIQSFDHTEASGLIQNEETRNSLLQCVIRSFNSMKKRISSIYFEEPILELTIMYSARLKSPVYHALLQQGCSQEQINVLMDAWVESSPSYFKMYLHHFVPDELKKVLSPHLGADLQANRAIVAGIIDEYNRFRVSKSDSYLGQKFSDSCARIEFVYSLTDPRTYWPCTRSTTTICCPSFGSSQT